MNFWKIFKNGDFGFNILEKGQIFRPFSGLSPSKLKILYTYHSILHTNFQNNRRYRRKRGPERVKGSFFYIDSRHRLKLVSISDFLQPDAQRVLCYHLVSVPWIRGGGVINYPPLTPLLFNDDNKLLTS